MISSLPQPSDTLQNFYSFVESESGRTISLQQAAFVGLQGMSFAFAHHPTNIVIEFLLPFNGIIDQLEESLAHEAGHGLLTYPLHLVSELLIFYCLLFNSVNYTSSRTVFF